jgi:GNAT superfamily N-acetyltransferase
VFQRQAGPLPPRLAEGAVLLEKRYRIRVRSIDMKRFDDELALIKKLFNAAWEKNWGYVPMTDREIDHLARQLKQIVVPELVLFAEREGETIGFAVSLPDLNVALRTNRSGRLFPGILKVLWAARKVHRLRIVLLGALPEWQGRGVDALLYKRTWETGVRRGYDWGEAGWILEDNHAMVNGLVRMGFEPYKTYRVYDRAL